MRTTLDIEATVLRELRDVQKRDGGTLGEIASRLLAEALARRPARPTRLEWKARPMGAVVDLEDKALVYAILDQADRAAEP
ncbi:MAG: antitoxin [Vicinamibacteria bacterium]